MTQRKRKQTTRICLGAAMLASTLLTAPAHAATTSSDFAWERLLKQIADSFSGPVAQSLLILAIVALGLALAFSEGTATRRVLGVIMGGTIAATAAGLVSSAFGLAGGATF